MPRELTDTASITWDSSTPSLAKANINPLYVWPAGKPLPFGSPIVYAGDSITAMAFDGTSNSQYGFMTWAQTFSRQIAYAGIYANAGISGNTSAQLWARYATDVLARSPKVVCLMIGTNDVLTVGAGASTAAINLFASNLASMIAANRSIGAVTILFKVLPIGSVGSPMSADQLLTWVGINGVIATRAAADVVLIDAEPLVGLRDANHTVVTNCFKVDYIHPSVRGAFLIGGLVAKTIKSLVADGDYFTKQIIPANTWNMAGVGPNYANGFANVSLPGSITQACTVVARMDGNGQTQNVTFTGPSCSYADRGGIFQNINLTGVFNIGDIIQGVIEVSTTDLVGVGSVGMDIIDLSSGEEISLISFDANSDIPKTSWSGILTTKQHVCTHNWASTNFAIVVYVGATTALSGTLTIGRIALMKGLT